MTQEEKAKRYDEAINTIRNLVNAGLIYEDAAIQVFPEIAESEDERIRKEIICFLRNIPNSNYTCEEMAAWLEKQGEQKPTDKVEPKFKVGDIVTNKKSKDTVKIVQILHDSYCCSGWDGAATVHSDFSISEQDNWELVELTAWSEEGGQKYSEDDIAAEEKAEYKKGFECGKQLVLKYPEDFDLCKKTLTDWSEGDEEMMSSTVFYLNEFKEVYQEGAQKCISWLKSLKDRIQSQPRQEWSEERENNILFLTFIIEECFKDKEKITLCSDTVCANFTKEDVIDRLKSLRPQSQWRPSDEQMDALKQAKTDACGKPYFNALASLYINLKGY